MGTPVTVPAAVNEEISPQDRLNGATGEELASWRKDGVLPPSAEERTSSAGKSESRTEEVEEKSEAKPATGEGSAPAAKEEKPASAAASAAAKPPKKSSERRDERFEELFGYLRTERERGDRLEAELRELRSGKTAAKEAAPQTAKTEAEEAMPTELDKDEKGEFKYKTVGELWKAQMDWTSRQTEKRVLEKIAKERGETEKATTEKETKKTADESWGKKVTASKEKHVDFEQVAFNPKVPLTVHVEIKDGKPELAEGSIIEQFVRDSELGAEVAYYLGQHPEIVERITGIQYDAKAGQFKYLGKRMNATDAMRTLVAVEAEVTEDETEEPSSAPKIPAKLPPPPPVLSAKRSAAPDDAEAALRAGNVKGYIEAMNARDAARSKRA